jgi:glycosidase
MRRRGPLPRRRILEHSGKLIGRNRARIRFFALSSCLSVWLLRFVEIPMYFWPNVFLASCLAAGFLPVAAQTASVEIPSPAAASKQQINHPSAAEMSQTAKIQPEKPEIDKPEIDKIDPPSWWAQFPSPMLLLHGHGLNTAQFSVSGQGVELLRSQSSQNGHWAILWLATNNAPAQTLSIVARHGSTEARASFVLAQRDHASSGHTGFSAADVLYLIMPDRFADGSQPNPPEDDRSAPRGWHGGDLAGIEQHLDYLHTLGVTTLWTTPVVSNGPMPESYHGYAATDLYAIDPHFGTLAGYRHLADALHARSMKLVIDLVPNHVGALHPWLGDPPTPTWFHGSRQSHLAVDNDFYQLVDPHAAPSASRRLTRGWFTDGMPDLNQEDPTVAQYLIQNALWWVETIGIDGIRLDTFPYVGRAFWHDFHAALHTQYPHLTTVGEVFHFDPQVTSFFAGGTAHAGLGAGPDTGLDTVFDFPLYNALRTVLTGDRPMTDLSAVLRQDNLYPHPERLVTFIGNHDTMRFLTAAHGSMPRLKLALGLSITLRGVPQLYSGDEIAMTGADDPDNRRDFPGGFPTDKRSAFTPNQRTASEEEAFSWTATLLAVRKAHPELQTGVEQNLLATDDVFAYVRARSKSGCTPDHAQERILIIANKSEATRAVEIPVDDTTLAGCTEFHALASTQPTAIEPAGDRQIVDKPGGDTFKFNAPAESMTVWSVR